MFAAVHIPVYIQHIHVHIHIHIYIYIYIYIYLHILICIYYIEHNMRFSMTTRVNYCCCPSEVRPSVRWRCICFVPVCMYSFLNCIVAAASLKSPSPSSPAQRGGRPPRGLRPHRLGPPPPPPWGPEWGGDRLGSGHFRILCKAPEDYTKPQQTIQRHRILTKC